MTDADLTDSFIARIEDSCDLFQRRQISAAILQVSIETNAAALRRLDPESAAVLASFAEVLQAIADHRDENKQFVEVCNVIDRIRDFRKLRRLPTEV